MRVRCCRCCQACTEMLPRLLVCLHCLLFIIALDACRVLVLQHACDQKKSIGTVQLIRLSVQNTHVLLGTGTVLEDRSQLIVGRRKAAAWARKWRSKRRRARTGAMRDGSQSADWLHQGPVHRRPLNIPTISDCPGNYDNKSRPRRPRKGMAHTAYP